MIAENIHISTDGPSGTSTSGKAATDAAFAIKNVSRPNKIYRTLLMCTNQ